MLRRDVSQGVTVVDRHHLNLVTPIIGAMYLWSYCPQDGWELSSASRATRKAGVVVVQWHHYLDEVDDVDDVTQNPVLALIRKPIPGSVGSRVDIPGAADRIDEVGEALRSSPFSGEIAIKVPTVLITVDRARYERDERDQRLSRYRLEQAKLQEAAEGQVNYILDLVADRYGCEVSDPVRDSMIRQAAHVGQISLPVNVVAQMCNDIFMSEGR